MPPWPEKLTSRVAQLSAYVAPPGPVPTTDDLRQVLELWLPDERLRRQVLVDNPARLYDFSTADRAGQSNSCCISWRADSVIEPDSDG